jgi:hypothetical protein
MGLDLGTLIGGNLGDLFKKVVGTFKLDPEVKAKIEAQIEQNRFEIAKIQAELEAKLEEGRVKEIEAAGANIRAEAGSGDRFTSRARPSFIYTMLGIFICNYIIFPLVTRPTLTFPEPLFWLFGSCMLGYTGARTWEKIGNPLKGPK